MVSPRGFDVVNTVAEIDGRATSWRRTVMTLTMLRLNGLNNRLWWGKNEQPQCATLDVCVSNKERRSKKLRSILGILPCSILRI
jgi:hypothetical protein